jgi:hypothetical protein
MPPIARAAALRMHPSGVILSAPISQDPETLVRRGENLPPTRAEQDLARHRAEFERTARYRVRPHAVMTDDELRQARAEIVRYRQMEGLFYKTRSGEPVRELVR